MSSCSAACSATPRDEQLVSLGDQPQEPRGVHLLRFDLQRIAGVQRHEDLGRRGPAAPAEGPSATGRHRPATTRAPAWGLVAPQQIDQSIDRDHPPGFDEEHDEEVALQAGTHIEVTGVGGDVQVAQDPEAQARRSCLAHRIGTPHPPVDSARLRRLQPVHQSGPDPRARSGHEAERRRGTSAAAVSTAGQRHRRRSMPSERSRTSSPHRRGAARAPGPTEAVDDPAAPRAGPDRSARAQLRAQRPRRVPRAGGRATSLENEHADLRG